MQQAGIIAAIILFVALEAALIGWLDLPISLYFRQFALDYPATYHLFEVTTTAGKSVWYLWPLGIVTLLCAALLRKAALPPRRRQQIASMGRQTGFAFLCIAATGLLTDSIKIFPGRARPVEYLDHRIYGFDPVNFHARFNSWPSGHATTALTLATLLSLRWPRLWPLWWLLGLFIALGRVVINQHYLADVIAGGLIGIVLTLAIQQTVRKYGIRHVERIFPIDASKSRP